MLLRICLIVAIVAGLAVGGLGYYGASTQIPALKDQRDKEHDAKVSEITAHGKTKTELKKTAAELASTQQELTDTKGERDKAVARAESQSKRADELGDKLSKTTKERDDAQNELASFKVIGLTPEQVINLNKSLKNSRAEVEAVNGEKVVLLRTITRLTNELAKYIGPSEYVKLPAGMHGKILTVDPKWDFVILDIGEDQGVIPDGELLVSRQGKLVAKIVVSRVQKDRCVANLVPGWKLGDMIEGDEVSPAHPAS
jgi:hypothetical protein